MKVFRKVSIYNKKVSERYYVDNEGAVYSKINSYRIQKRTGKQNKAISIKQRIKKEIGDMKIKNLKYTRITIDGIEKYIVLLQDGTLLKRLSTSINKQGYVIININDFLEKRKTYSVHSLISSVFDRELKNNEHIHHLDFNKLNNNENNLLIIKNSDHSKFHELIKKGLTKEAQEIINRYKML